MFSIDGLFWITPERGVTLDVITSNFRNVHV